MFGDIGGILGFNRTFMELKALLAGMNLNGLYEFQSHLYGIESRYLPMHTPGQRVSIAPLWN